MADSLMVILVSYEGYDFASIELYKLMAACKRQ